MGANNGKSEAGRMKGIITEFGDRAVWQTVDAPSRPGYWADHDRVAA